MPKSEEEQPYKPLTVANKRKAVNETYPGISPSLTFIKPVFPPPAEPPSAHPFSPLSPLSCGSQDQKNQLIRRHSILTTWLSTEHLQE